MSFPSYPIHVFLVAPPLLCWGFERLVHTAYLGIRITGTADTLEGALATIRGVRADLMIVDHEEYTGCAALEEAAKLVPILLLTSYAMAAEAEIGGHVAAIVSKSDSPASLLRAIEETTCGRGRGRSAHSCPPFAGAADPNEIRISKLTARERELIVAMLCSDTEPGKVIAGRLCISEQTLRNHLSSIYSKLGLHSRLGLHAFAVKHGLDRTAHLAAHDPCAAPN